MELVDHWNDEEQQLVIIEDDDEKLSSSLTITDPFGPEMVVQTSEMAGAEAPTQGSTTPKPVATPEPTAPTPEMVSTPSTSPGGEPALTTSNLEASPELTTKTADTVSIPTTLPGETHTDSANGFSIEAIRTSLNNMLEASGGNLAPPDVSSTQNLWGNLGTAHFLSATEAIFTNVSEAERNKMTTELIINCIQKQEALWNSTDPKFGDNKLCPLLWNNIASVCGLDVKKLKAKWSTLKKTFKKEYVKCTATGLTSKSPNFQAMSFLEGEIKREIQRESHEKNIVIQQLLRRFAGKDQQDVSGNSVVHNIEDEDSSDTNDDDDDCMIVESKQRPQTEITLQSVTTDTSYLSSQAPSSKSVIVTRDVPQNASRTLHSVRPKNISELQKKLPSGSENTQASEPSTNSENRSSPEVVCLEESKKSQKTVKQYTVVPGQPIIKFNPPTEKSTKKPSIVAEPAMPKNWIETNNLKVEEDDNLKIVAPAEIKQCARKSISRANLKLFPSRNVVRNADTKPGHSNPVYKDKILQPQDSTAKANKPLSVQENRKKQWKIEKPRSIQASQKQPTETARTKSSCLPKPDCSITPTVRILPKPSPIETGRKSMEQQQLRTTRVRSSSPSHLDSSVKPTTTILPKPEPVEDDDIQIIKEIPGPSAHKGTTNQQAKSRKSEIVEDQPFQLKRIRTSTDAPPRVTVQRKLDKERENSANEHFLLSLLYDAENMSNEQFRCLKKHSTALASMILEPK